MKGHLWSATELFKCSCHSVSTDGSWGPISPHAYVISLPTASDLLALDSSHKYSGPVKHVAPRGLTIAEGKKGWCITFDKERDKVCHKENKEADQGKN